MKQPSAISLGKKGVSAVLNAMLVALTLMTALVVVSAPPAEARAEICSGFSSQNLDQAKAEFRNRCHREWNPNSGSDVCDYDPASRQFLCSGPKSFYCTGGFDSNIDRAKALYKTDCGEEWRSNSGFHYCVWYGGSRQAWQCHNNAY